VAAPDEPWETSDLGTAAFVHMRGLKLLGSRLADRGESGGGKFVFMFADPKQEGYDLMVEYLNSECREFDSKVRSLKKLCYGKPKPSGSRR